MGMHYFVWLQSGVLLAVSALIYWTAPRENISPRKLSHHHSTVQSVTGAHTSRLNESFMLFEGQIIGPYSVSHDPVTGNIFTGTNDGLVWKIDRDLGRAEPILRIGDDHPNCGRMEYHQICGRVLGIKFLTGDKLIVADAYRGIIAIHLNTKRKQVLVQPDKNLLTRSLKLFHSLDVSKEGIIYFTVSSMKWSLEKSIYSLLEVDSSGRVYSYDLMSRELKLMASNLMFVTGLTISHDGKSLLVSEYSMRRILSIDIRNPIKVKVLIDNLIGFPNNINKGLDDTYFITIPSVYRLSILSFLHNHPSINAWSAWLLPRSILERLLPGESGVLEVNRQGQIITFMDGGSDSITFVSDAHQLDEYIFLGSFKTSGLAVLRRK